MDQTDQHYLCPECGSGDLAAGAVEHKTAYITPEGDIHDEKGGHTDFHSFRCLECTREWQAEDELEAAIDAMAAANTVVNTFLTRAEESMYYTVLDALQALRDQGEDSG